MCVCVFCVYVFVLCVYMCVLCAYFGICIHVCILPDLLIFVSTDTESKIVFFFISLIRHAWFICSSHVVFADMVVM